MRRTWVLSSVPSTLAVVLSFLVVAPPAAALSEIPDGIVAYVTTVNGHEAIYSLDLVHTDAVHPLVDLGDRDATQPSWSSDGTRLAFTGETTPGGATAIFVANADGSWVEQVTAPSGGESDSDPAWSPSGDEIVFARTLATGLSEILVALRLVGHRYPNNSV